MKGIINTSPQVVCSEQPIYISHDTNVSTIDTFIIERMLKGEILKHIH